MSANMPPRASLTAIATKVCELAHDEDSKFHADKTLIPESQQAQDAFYRQFSPWLRHFIWLMDAEGKYVDMWDLCNDCDAQWIFGPYAAALYKIKLMRRLDEEARKHEQSASNNQ